MRQFIYLFLGIAFIVSLAVGLGRAQNRRRRSSTRSFFTCQYKTISVPGENGRSQLLSRSYDFKQIASVMKTNRAYEVSEHYNGDGIIISRTFDGVKYNLVFEHREGASAFNLHTYDFKGYPNRGVAWGEKCSTPNRLIRTKVYRMIEDLPLDDERKAELKQYVMVTKAANGGFF